MATTCLCIGDPHFKSVNVVELDAYCKRIYEIIEEKEPDFVVVMGDMLDRHDRIDVEPYNRSIDFLRRLSRKAKTFLLIGNHDYINNQQFLTKNHGYNALKYWDSERYDITIVDKIEIITSDAGEFFLCPYVPNGRFIEALTTSEEMWEAATCIFAHQEFKGCKMGAKISEDGDDWPIDNPLVISGHIHNEQIPQDNIRYVGSSMQHAFGESSDKCIYFISFSDMDEPKYERISMGLREKRIIYIDNEEIDTFDPTSYPNSTIKLVVRGTSEKFQVFRRSDTYKKLTSLGVRVESQLTLMDDETKTLIQESLHKKANYIEIMEELVLKSGDEIVDAYKSTCGKTLKKVELEFENDEGVIDYECNSSECESEEYESDEDEDDDENDDEEA